MKSTLLFCGALAPVLIGCAGAQRDPLPAPDSTPPVRVVTETVTVRDRGAEQLAAELQLQLVDKEAQIEELQARLDEAERDVVRSLAKVQTLATRAEAASAMAEAEVALETLRRAVGSQGAGVARDSVLLAQANAAFNRQNYGGAVWLSNQAKNRATVGRGRLIGADSLELLEGEKRFALPVRFETVGRTNLRAGPGTSFAALTTLDIAAPLMGYSYLQQWVHVMDAGGLKGWVFYKLVARRSSGGN
jgi:hypothetical protein